MKVDSDELWNDWSTLLKTALIQQNSFYICATQNICQMYKILTLYQQVALHIFEVAYIDFL